MVLALFLFFIYLQSDLKKIVIGFGVQLKWYIVEAVITGKYKNINF